MWAFAHHKCATNLFRKLFSTVAADRNWSYEVHQGRNDRIRGRAGTPKIELFVNSTTEELYRTPTTDLGVHMVRDLRDALVSGYWSWKNTHINNNEEIIEAKEILEKTSVAEGLRYMLDHLWAAEQLKDWPKNWRGDILDVKYENMIGNPKKYHRLILDHLRIPYGNGLLKKVVRETSFKKITGRKPGRENRDSHFRKGTSGDWRNHFTKELARDFHARYGELLIRWNYEKDGAWVDSLT